MTHRITVPGTYWFQQDETITTPVPMISAVGVSYVNIILCGMRGIGYAGLTNTAAAIEATNCPGLRVVGIGATLNGFGFGGRFTNCPGLDCSGLIVQQALWDGIYAEGDDMEIRNCRVDDVGGIQRDDPNTRCFGIQMKGTKIRMLDNTVGDVRATGDEEACLFGTSEGSGIFKGNVGRFAQVRNRQFGIWGGGNTANDRMETVYNTIQNAKKGADIGYGVLDHNTFIGCDTPWAINPNTQIGAFNSVFP